MIPIDPGEGFGELRVYGAGQEEYHPLVGRVYPGGHVFLTKWSLSADERMAILDGANVFLHVLTFGHPLQPVSLWIEGAKDDPFVQDPQDQSEEEA